MTLIRVGIPAGHPAQGAVTDAKVATTAAINVDKTADGTTNKVYSATDKTKLAGIATGANVYAAENARDDVGAALVQSSGMSITINDPADTITFANASATVRGVTPSAGTIAIDANTFGNAIDSTLAADATLNVPTNGYQGQIIQGSALASAAQRILSFNASYSRLAGIGATLTIPSGKVGRYAIRRTDITGSAKWIVEAAAVEQ